MVSRRCLVALGMMLAIGPASGRAQVTPPPTVEAIALAERLIRTEDENDRNRILADERLRINLDLRIALSTEANRLIGRRQYREALRGYHLARAVSERIGDRKGVGLSALGLGTAHGQQGDYAQAAQFLGEALNVGQEIADTYTIEAALNNLGIVYRLQGEYEEALTFYQRALALEDALEDRSPVPRTLNNIGVVHMQRGAYRDALEYFHRSLRLKEANGQTADLPSTLGNIGQVYELIGDHDRALEYVEHSITINERLGNKTATRSAVELLGRLRAAQGRPDAALGHYRRALELNEGIGSKAETAGVLQNMGNAYRARGEVATALDYYRRSLEIREAINDRPGIADTLVDMATVLERQGDAAAAVDAAERATRLAGETGNREIFWRARLASGTGHDALKQTARARDAYEEAIDMLETLRGDVAGGPAERQRYFESRLAPYHRLAELLIIEGRAAEALGVAERARSRVMLDMLRAGRPEARLLTADERQHERQLERDMTLAFRRLWEERARPQPDAERLRRLEAELRAARNAHADLRTTLYDAHPVLRLSRGDASPGSMQDASALLESAAGALVEFMVTAEATYGFVVTQGAPLRSFRIGIAQEELRRRITAFRAQLAMRDLDFSIASRELYDLLLGPIAAELRGKRQLVILPDGVLWELPFQALQPRPQRYLIEDASLSYAPSIAVLREMRLRRGMSRERAGTALLALGDPELSDFAPLPDAARQVRSLARLYDGQSLVFTGADATEERLRASGHDAAILHLATHGVLDDTSPMYSFVALSGAAGFGAARDGRLEAWEVSSLQLRADLVVLAACETARGRLGAGEGVVGLSWAFFLAGAPRTVVSLWKVDAASTTDLMIGLHRQLRRAGSGGPRVAESLRAAALSLLRDARYRHPFYWAGFSVIGDGL